MQVRWYLYRFDYARYVWLRPLLRAATTPEALAALAEGPEVEAIADAVADEEMSLPAARSAMVHAICCLGEPLPFDTGLARLIAALERIPDLEDGAGLLNRMLSGKNLEPWLLPSSGLTGFLTAQEASALYVAYTAVSIRTLRRARMPGASVRKRGLLVACATLLRHLSGSGPQPDDMLRLLGRLLDNATRHGEGIAAVTA